MGEAVVLLNRGDSMKKWITLWGILIFGLTLLACGGARPMAPDLKMLPSGTAFNCILNAGVNLGLTPVHLTEK